MSLLVLDNLDWISKKTSEKEQSFELKEIFLYTEINVRKKQYFHIIS